jgi:hypothetical protein
MHTEFQKRVKNKQECHSAPVRCVWIKQNITLENPPRNWLQCIALSVTYVCVWGSVLMYIIWEWTTGSYWLQMNKSVMHSSMLIVKWTLLIACVWSIIPWICE